MPAVSTLTKNRTVRNPRLTSRGSMKGAATLKMPATLAPMEALSVDTIPIGSEWQYEPKWDGFRCIAFRAGADVRLQSKAQQPLARYFSELVAALADLDAPCFVLDGEIAIPQGRGFSFDALLQRIHPAASRIARLSGETPAILVVFDLLAGEDGRSMLDAPLRERRVALETFAAAHFPEKGIIRLSPATKKLSTAKRWLSQTGATLDGIIAKRVDLP